MKKIIIIISILFSAYVLHSQEYQKMVKEGNKWNYLLFLGGTIGNGDYVTQSLSLKADTLIEDKVYKKIMCEIIALDKAYPAYYAGALREDDFTQQVFLKLPNVEERVLYSFNQQVGDTIAVDTLEYDERMKYVEYSVRTVKSVEIVEFNNTKRRRIEISDSTYIKSTSAEWEPFETYRDYWYEGFGGTEHTFVPISHEITYDEGLLCFWEKDNQIYHNSLGYDCEYTEDIKTGMIYETGSSIVEIYPNLTSGRLTVKSNVPIKSVVIADLRGAVITKQEQCSNLDISNSPAGIYVVKIENSNGFVVEKIVKY